jgi:tetratricopeptide (TPR) repeat protein
MRGEAQMQLGERETGKADLREALQMAPDYAFPGMLLFDEYFADEQFDQAEAVLSIMQEHIADEFVAARQVQLAARQDDKTTALDAFRNLCESPIEATWPITTALSALRKAGWSEDADEVLKESIQSRIFHPQAALLWLDSPSAEELDFSDRLDILDRTLQKHPRFLPAHDRKAEQLTRMEQFADAIAACSPKEFGSEPPIILQGRAAWIEYTRGRRDKAISQMESIVGKSPDYYWGWQQLANWYDAAGDFEKYLQAAEEMVRIAPRDPTSFGYRGEAKLRLKDPESAKDDFRTAFELDPNYGFAGIHLLDQQIADDELDEAGETLEVLRENGDDAHIRLRALRLAIRRNSTIEADEVFEEIATDIETPMPILKEAIEMMEDAGWDEQVDEIIDRCVDDEAANPLVGRVWMQRAMERKDKDISERLDELLEKGDVGQEALIARLEGLANARNSEAVFSLIDHYREELRADTSAWGKTGWALARVNAYDGAILWMADWAEHADAQSWMLINLAIAYRAMGRDAEAQRVSQFALANSAPDLTIMFHSVWLALDEALAGRTADALKRIEQHERDKDQLDPYFRVVHAMCLALVQVQQGGSRAFAAARKLLEETAQANQELDSDPAIHRAWKKCVARMARDAFSIGAWLWSRRSAKNPPLPPPLPSTQG